MAGIRPMSTRWTLLLSLVILLGCLVIPGGELPPPTGSLTIALTSDTAP